MPSAPPPLPYSPSTQDSYTASISKCPYQVMTLRAFGHLAAVEQCFEPTDLWPRGVTASTLDSESSNRGSNPREAYCAHLFPSITIFCRRHIQTSGCHATTHAVPESFRQRGIPKIQPVRLVSAETCCTLLPGRKSPTVGLEPTTTRLRALRSAD